MKDNLGFMADTQRLLLNSFKVQQQQYNDIEEKLQVKELPIQRTVAYGNPPSYNPPTYSPPSYSTPATQQNYGLPTGQQPQYPSIPPLPPLPYGLPTPQK